MPTNKGFIMSVKTNAGNYIPLYPTVPKYRVHGFDRQELYGPYTMILSASNWINKQQTLALDGITANDIPNCVKVLTGTEEEMFAQDQAYSCLDIVYGIESLDNAVRFTCTDIIPTVDFTVQVSWFR